MDQCGVVGFELIELIDLSTIIGLGASTGNQQTDLFSAQLASVPPAIFTNVKVVNTSSDGRALTLTPIAEDGNHLADPVQRFLGPGEFFEADAGDLFDFPPGSIGSLKIEADGSGLIGDVVFGDPTGGFAAALPLDTNPFTDAVFSQVANLTGFFTGLALFNPGQIDATVTIEVFTADGELSGSGEIDLAAGHRLAQTVDQILPQTAGQAGGYIRVRSTQPIVAQQLFGTSTLTLLSAVPPTVIQ